MKKIFILNLIGKVFLFAVLILNASLAGAQVTGTKTIGIDYATLAAAVNALNTTGISGAVTINVPAGYTETAPAGGYLLGSTVLNGSTSAANTLTIRKNGAGANPLLTAPVGTTTDLDGIFTLQGPDYVTIDGIDLTESAANTTPTTWMEWGYGLIKLNSAAPFDGCQNVTIKNCKITLNILNTTSVGIYANDHDITSTSELSITDAADAMNNCKFYSNIIQNCNTGITLSGYSGSGTLYDQNNDIGGTGAGTANTIQNFAGADPGAGIDLRYQNNINVAYNNINNMGGGGIAATGRLYGVYMESGTDNSVNITNNTLILTQGSTSDYLYGVNISSGGTGTVNVNSNTFTANGGSSGDMYMIYFDNGSSVINTNTNNFANINVATSGSLYLIDHSSASYTTNITCNNNFTSGTAVPYINNTGTGGVMACYWSNSGSGSGYSMINNNNFSNITLAGSEFYGIDETNGGSGQNKFIHNNIISNISNDGTSYGLRVGYSSTQSILNNTVSFLDVNSGVGYGIYIVNGTTDTVAANNVHDIVSAYDNVYGIYIDGGDTHNIYKDTVSTMHTAATYGLAYGLWQGSGTTVNIYKNKIYDISADGTGSSVNGMYLSSGDVTVYNNIIGDLRAPNLIDASGTQLVGMYMDGGSSYKAYYNTVYMNAISTGSDFASTAVFAGSAPPVTLQNNIFVNTSVPNGAGLTVAHMRASASLPAYQPASNNNLFYAGTPGPANVIFFDGSTTYPTLAAYKLLVTTRDGSSVTENPPFLSLVGSSASFLHISTSVPTQVESGGVNIAGITTDIDGVIRAGNPGYAGTGSAPDIGAAEGNYIILDLTAPNIVYTILPNACTTGDRTFTATITDATGVPVTGLLVPRVYYRKGAGTWQSAAGTLSSGSATSSTWSFNISASAMGGLSIGDVVSYFVIAQDMVTTPNLGSNPFAGLVATDVNTITTFPTTPNTYSVLPTLTGTYTVGVGMTYSTITAAVNDYNGSCVSGPVVFQLTDPSYGIGETFPITIGAIPASSPLNTLTIRPAPGVSTVIGGNASSIFVFDGADYVTIDGANSPVTNSICPRVAATRDITIIDSSTSSSSAVVWIQTTAASDGATNNTIRNCNIIGSGNTNTLFGIGSGGSSSIAYNSTGAGNNNNRIENDSIAATQTGIYSMGASAVNKNTGTVINQNKLNAPSPDNIANNGIFAGFEDNITISGNYLAEITNSSSSDVIGINLGFDDNSMSNSNTTGNDVTNATVTYNKIDNITQTNTWSSVGIAVAGVTSGTNTIANNMISGVLGEGTGGDFSSGIFLGGAAGGVTNIFYNSVNITGSLTDGNTPCFAIAVTGPDPILNIKNNVFVNSGNPGSTSLVYAIGLGYSTFANISADRNDYYSISDLGLTDDLGTGGTSQATLTDWQSATSVDVNSKNVNPTFASASDLHLSPVGANVLLMDTGIPVAITSDYDCAPRSASAPDLGINEFTIPNCVSVIPGTIAAATSSFCGSGTTTVTVTGATSDLGTTYQWLSSTDSVSWTAISGATNASYTMPAPITTTTYYRFRLSCIYSGAMDSIAIKITINPLPVITVTPDGGGYCSGTSGSVAMTATGAVTYGWSPATGLSATTGASVVASPLATTVYVVSGTDAIGCVGTHSSTVTVTTTPPPVIVTPATTTICSGGSVALTATDTLPSNIFSDDFNSGLGAWVIDNTGSTSVSAIPSTEWSGEPDGYSYSSDVFNSPDASSFVMSNSDPGGSGSTTHSMLISPTFSLAGYTAATLSYEHYYRYISSTDQAKVEISTDGGTTWILLVDYALAGVDAGSATSFASDSYDLSPYLGNTNCKVRFNFQANWGWYWALDNVAINGTGSFPNITWSPTADLYNDAGLTVPYTGGVTSTVYAAPTTTAAPVVNTYVATSANGACTNTGTGTVRVNPLPNAGAITGATVVCQGASITLSDTISGGVWTSSNASATVSGSGIVTGVSGGTDTISYSFTNVCGTAVATSVITINPAPDAGSISGPSNVCGGGATITLTPSVSGGAWSASNANATVSSGVVTGVATGRDTISYSVTNSCGTAVATFVVTVDQVPDAGTISGPSSVCAGASITLTDTVTGGTWSSSNPAQATVSSSGVVTGITSGTLIITYTYTNSCGTDNALIPFGVNPQPVAYTVTGGGVYCTGGAGVHVGLSNSDIGITYQLYIGSVPSGSATGVAGPLDFGLETAVGTYTVLATSSFGCTNNMIGSVTVDINPVTPPSVTISGPAGTGVCTGSTATFNAIAVNGGVSPTYQWTVNGVNVSTAPSYTYMPANGDVISVLLTSSTCALPDTASSTIVVNVVPYAMPTISITADPGSSVCPGSAVTFSATTTYEGPTPLLRWTVNGINVATGPTYTFIPANGDVVYCALLSSFPCRLADSVFSSSITMSVDIPLLPSVVIVAHPGTLITLGQYDTLTAVVTNGGSYQTYQWTINAINIPGATNATYITNSFTNGDSVSVRVMANTPCGILQTFNWLHISVGNVGVAQTASVIGDIRLIPNPNKGAFTIKGTLTTTNDADVSYEITDMLGQVIYKNTTVARQGQLNEQVTLPNTIANGMYILNVRSGDDRQTFHFVIEQ